MCQLNLNNTDLDLHVYTYIKNRKREISQTFGLERHVCFMNS